MVCLIAIILLYLYYYKQAGQVVVALLRAKVHCGGAPGLGQRVNTTGPHGLVAGIVRSQAAFRARNRSQASSPGMPSPAGSTDGDGAAQ